jgi:hypothetical protein
VLLRVGATGNAHVVRALLTAGADVGATARNGGSALLCAAVNGHVDSARVLPAAGAAVYAADEPPAASGRPARKAAGETVQRPNFRWASMAQQHVPELERVLLAVGAALDPAWLARQRLQLKATGRCLPPRAWGKRRAPRMLR